MEKTDWKRKASKYAWDNKELRKRNKELRISRDGWKAKSVHHKARADKLSADIKKIKQKMNELIEFQ